MSFPEETGGFSLRKQHGGSGDLAPDEQEHVLCWPKKHLGSTIGYSKSISSLGDCPESKKPVTAGIDEGIWPGQVTREGKEWEVHCLPFELGVQAMILPQDEVIGNVFQTDVHLRPGQVCLSYTQHARSPPLVLWMGWQGSKLSPQLKEVVKCSTHVNQERQKCCRSAWSILRKHGLRHSLASWDDKGRNVYDIERRSGNAGFKQINED